MVDFSSSRYRTTLLALLCVLGTGYPVPSPAIAQQGASESDKEKQIVERFLEVLRRRPRPGTALDRVYGYHVQNGSLDEFMETLLVPETAPHAGQQRMIVGLLQSQRGRPALAADAFAEAENLLPEDAMCSYLLGRSLLTIGETEKAAAALERATERKPARNEAIPIFTELGRLYGRAGRFDKALVVWTKLEQLFPGDAKVAGRIARTLADEGNLQEALARYESLAKSAQREEDKVAFAVQAAEMHRRLGNSDQAVSAFEQILSRLRPGSWMYGDVQTRIEECFLSSGDFDSLAAYYRSKLAESGGNLALQMRLGGILVSAGRLDEAQETLEQATERAPNDVDLRLTLCDVLISKGDMQAAARQYEVLVEQDPNNPDYLLRWGQILLEDESSELSARRDAASEVWQRLADSRHDDAATIAQIADRFRGIDRNDKAIALYRQAIDIDPDAPQYREYLGEFFHQLNRTDEAIEIWESIAADDRRGRESLVRLAEVFTAFEFNDRAIDAWRDAAEFGLSFSEELRFAKSLRGDKQYDEAFVRLEAAEAIAESAEEQEQLLTEQIATYQEAGTLREKIAAASAAEPSATNLRKLAIMQSAAGQLTSATIAINRALDMEPESVDMLIVAADIAELQSRYREAATLLEKLSKLDARFRTNYLRRVAELEIRLGQVDDAMQTCESLIDADPMKAESYSFMARLAFQAGRDEQAATILRRAMKVAPRDNSARMLLASRFAERYRTEEAIDLYWQAMQHATETEERISLIGQLATLYDRKSEMDTLISRIEQLRRGTGDGRTIALLISAAHESVRDYGAARKAIGSLLARQPRDVALLQAMVRLCDLAGEYELAAEYQQKIIALADTPDNRLRLVQIQLDGQLIDLTTALSQRISLVADPVRLGRMISATASRGDLESAIAFCREAIRRDPSLWDVKLYLAELLLHMAGEEREQLRAEAVALCDEIRVANFPRDAAPPTIKPKPMRAGKETDDPSNPRSWSQSRIALQSAYRLGRYANSSIRSTGFKLVQPRTFMHARTIAAMLQITKVALESSDDSPRAAIEQLCLEKFPVPALDQVNHPDVLWQHLAIRAMASDLDSPLGEGESGSSVWPQKKDVDWRLAQLDPAHAASSITSLYLKRAIAAADDATERSAEFRGEDEVPLTDAQLEILVGLFEHAKADVGERGATSSSSLWNYYAILTHEFQLAGKPDQAAEYALPPVADDAPMPELIEAIRFHLQMNQVERADALVDRLLPAARRGVASAASGGPLPTGLSGLLAKEDAEFVQRHQLKLLDALIAHALRENRSLGPRHGSLTSGSISTYARMLKTSFGIQVQGPLSPDLLSKACVTELINVSLDAAGKKPSQPIRIPQRIIEHLQQPLPEAPSYELKTRRILAAYAHWWSGRPQECFQELVALSEEYSDDIDLRLEGARLASELQQPRLALEILDSFEPLESEVSVRKEMAAMNLATEVGDLDRVKQAAQRLVGMRMDTTARLSLVEQLRWLGMNSEANAVLQRLQGRRSPSASTELEIANAFLRSGDKAAASEVARAVMRRLGGAGGYRSADAGYRRQAATILSATGELDSLVERAERRLENSPSSTRAKIELAELYVAAGQSKDAEQIWSLLSGHKLRHPGQMIARAVALGRARKDQEAVRMYLAAFEKDPSLLNSHYTAMRNHLRRASMQDEVFESLLKVDPKAIRYSRFDDILELGGTSGFSEAKRKFVVHGFKNPDSRTQFFYVLRKVPKYERDKIPELREIMLSRFCSQDAFKPTTGLWRISSYSSNGSVKGAFIDWIGVIKRDEDAERRFREAAKLAQNNEDTEATGTFLLAFLDLRNEQTATAAVNAMRDLLRRDADAGNAANPTVTINSQLMWQAGQLLESTLNIDDRPALLVDFYRLAARESNSSFHQNFRRSVQARLVEALVDNQQIGEARRLLLEVSDKIHRKPSTQYPPDYASYMELSTQQTIAEKLASCGCPIDALTVYRRGLSQPAKFGSAERIGNVMMRNFEMAATKVNKEINPDNSIEYLAYLAEDAINGKPIFGSQFARLNTSLGNDGEQPSSGLLLAIESAASTDQGKQQLDAFASRLGQHAAAGPDDWSIPAMQLLIAIATESDSLADAADDLFSRLPSEQEILAATGTAKAAEYRSLTCLIVPTMLASKSGDEAVLEIGNRLAMYLGVVADGLQEPQLRLSIASLQGDRSQWLEDYIVSLEAKADPGTPLPTRQQDTCLKIAKLTAQDGDVLMSTRALKLALQSGPPMSRTVTDGSNAFLITRNRSRSVAVSDDRTLQLIESLREIINLYSTVTGYPLGPGKPKSRIESSDAESELIAVVADTLQAIVLPEARMGAVFPYAKPIVTDSPFDRLSSRSEIVPVSVSIAMGRAASFAGQHHQLRGALLARHEQAADTTLLSGVIVDAAVASGETESIAEAVEMFAAALDNQLPKESFENIDSALTTITTQAQMDAGIKNITIDTVIRTLWPLANDSSLMNAETQQQVHELLQRTKMLINSDSSTASRHREIIRRIDSLKSKETSTQRYQFPILRLGR